MLIRIATLVLLLLTVSSPAHAEPQKKLRSLKETNAISQKLQAMAEERMIAGIKGTPIPRNQSIEAITRLLEHQNNTEVLQRIILRCDYDRFPGNAEDQHVDEIYEVTQYIALKRIEKIGGPAAIASIKEIQMISHPDGMWSLQLKEALVRLQKKL